MRRIAGVESVGAITLPPIVGCCGRFELGIEGQTFEAGRAPMVTGNVVTPGYFESVRIPLVAGRVFTDADTATAPKVVVISQTFAARWWPRGGALGRRIETGNGLASIVGIVGEIGVAGDHAVTTDRVVGLDHALQGGARQLAVEAGAFGALTSLATLPDLRQPVHTFRSYADRRPGPSLITACSGQAE